MVVHHQKLWQRALAVRLKHQYYHTIPGPHILLGYSVGNTGCMGDLLDHERIQIFRFKDSYNRGVYAYHPRLIVCISQVREGQSRRRETPPQAQRQNKDIMGREDHAENQ